MAGEFKQPFDAPPQTGTKAIAFNPQPAKGSSRSPSFAELDQRFRKRIGAILKQYARFVGGRFAGLLELPPANPHERMPPKSCCHDLSKEIPKRITPG